MLYSKNRIQYEMRKFIKVNTLKGFTLYCIDMGMYITFIAGIFILPDLWMQFLCGVLAGAKMSGLSILAHDAAHNSLTKSKRINKFLAITSLTPCLFNYELWLHDHNNGHHTMTNDDHPDSYTPLSKKQYDSLTKYQKWKYRLFRKPSIAYFGLYYLSERWWKVKFYPSHALPDEVKVNAYKYFIFLNIYLLVYLSILVIASLYSSVSTIEAIVFGFIIPFYTFQSLYSFGVYIQHTHPKIAWFNYSPNRKNEGRQEFISTHYIFPGFLNLFLHNIFNHSAHHVCPAIPSYCLGDAQKRLNELLGENVIVEKFSIKRLFEIMKICKLYDYERGHWVDYDGYPVISNINTEEDFRCAA